MRETCFYKTDIGHGDDFVRSLVLILRDLYGAQQCSFVVQPKLLNPIHLLTIIENIKVFDTFMVVVVDGVLNLRAGGLILTEDLQADSDIKSVHGLQRVSVLISLSSQGAFLMIHCPRR